MLESDPDVMLKLHVNRSDLKPDLKISQVRVRFRVRG
jgi:hypothetical protein